MGFWFPVDFIHSRRRSYYLFFTTCSLLLVRSTRNSEGLSQESTRNSEELSQGVYPKQRGKLARITQACGNRRFTASG